MFKHIRPVWTEINLDNAAFNIRQIKNVCKGQDIYAVIKADAYGHGAVDMAKVFKENGANGFAVAVLSEGIELRKSGIDSPILVLGFTPPSLIDTLIRYDIEQSVFNYDMAKEISNIAIRKNKIAKIHIVLDSGMGRIGFLPTEKNIEEVVNISKLKKIEIEGLFSHFSTADEKDKEYSLSQLENFNRFYEQLIKRGVKINKRHISNSAAIIDIPDINFEVVRPGIILYGYYPSDFVDKDILPLKQVMKIKTNIVHIKNLPKGYPIGYGRRFVTDRESIIATLPVGYADGYTRLLFNKGKVIIRGKFAPVIGSICMDQCMIDVTDIDDVKIGDEVILLGEESGLKYDAEDIARDIGTISYEILTMIGKRIPRVYIKDGNVVKVRNYV